MGYHRRSIRLQTYDYASAGAYFVTICAYQSEYLFGEIRGGEMRVNEIGRIVRDVWDGLPSRFPAIETDEFVVMPNHIHGIIWIRGVGAPLVGALGGMSTERGGMSTERAGTRPAPTSVGNVIGAFKSISTVEYIRYQKRISPAWIPRLWQRNYYERIIRSESELYAVRRYIRDNP